ncbi:MAG: Na+/H+ antiporter NhaC family protein [Halieaceae bacterium]|nr:Na+/H+ antiporter NhaC family protein [Halieaceae bacterium]
MESTIQHWGLYSLIPTILVIVLAIATHRPLQSLLIGTAMGHMMLSGWQFFPSFTNGAVQVLTERILAWIGLAVGLFGSLIALLVKSGGATAFSNGVSKIIKSRGQAIFVTWLLGIVIFIDDYLNALAVSAAMKKVTDRFKISREMLAYVVDSTAAPVCILVPVTSWAIYVIGLLESNGYAEQGEGFFLYVQSIPYMFYAWFCLLLVPLVGTHKIPVTGPMKKCELRANSGYSLSDNYADIQFDEGNNSTEVHIYNFFVPIVLLLFTLWLFNVDLLQSVVATLVLTAIFYFGQRLLSWTEIVTTIMTGFKHMVPVLAIVAVSFMLRDVNDKLGLAQFVIATVKPLMSPLFMPGITFVTLALIAFATGSFWGLYAIALPIVIPLAQAMDLSMPLVIGAVISAGAFGSHACFYGDATVLSAQGSGCTPLDHAFTQLPYALLAAVLAMLGFIVLAWVL